MVDHQLYQLISRCHVAVQGSRSGPHRCRRGAHRYRPKSFIIGYCDTGPGNLGAAVLRCRPVPGSFGAQPDTRVGSVGHKFLQLHGEQDPIVRASAGRATARAIDGARLVTFPGVGHDLPDQLWPTVAQEMHELAVRSRKPVA
ncbi:MAG TPA: alpha/beta hydrolase [Dermatophilaceae bacterium]|nr:alpha/beta hydrolase [Dermatophilaceae bacterium]